MAASLKLEAQRQNSARPRLKDGPAAALRFSIPRKRMQKGHTCASGACTIDRQPRDLQTACGQGCNGGNCDDALQVSPPVLQGAECSSIYCDPFAAAGRPLTATERRMCFKCKTAKAEVGDKGCFVCFRMFQSYQL